MLELWHHKACLQAGANLEIVREGGGGNVVFWKIDHRIWTFFQLSPISKVNFGLLREGGMAQCPPPPKTPLLTSMRYSGDQ